jgi:hypothetical protein
MISFKHFFRLFFAVITLIDISSVQAFHLFDPIPSDKMRSLSTDRPDKTESPYSVAAGHVQIETDIVVHSIDKTESAGVKTKTTSTTYNNLNFKLGISDNTDLQFVIPSYVKSETKQSGSVVSESSGIGDLTLRYKINLYGNDEGPFSFGIMPYVKLSTGDDELTNNKTEGGLMLPFAIELPKGWSMGTMFQVDNKYNESSDSRRTDYIITWTLGHDIIGDLAGFFELYSQYSDHSSQNAVATFDLGLTYAITDRIQLDGGAFFGMTEDTEDSVYFLGISALF